MGWGVRPRIDPDRTPPTSSDDADIVGRIRSSFLLGSSATPRRYVHIAEQALHSHARARFIGPGRWMYRRRRPRGRTKKTQPLRSAPHGEASVVSAACKGGGEGGGGWVRDFFSPATSSLGRHHQSSSPPPRNNQFRAACAPHEAGKTRAQGRPRSAASSPRSYSFAVSSSTSLYISLRIVRPPPAGRFGRVALRPPTSRRGRRSIFGETTIADRRFCRRRPRSDHSRKRGGGRGSIIVSTQRPTTSYVNLQGDFLPLAEIFYLWQRFFTWACKKSRILEIKSLDLKSVVSYVGVDWV